MSEISLILQNKYHSLTTYSRDSNYLWCPTHLQTQKIHRKYGNTSVERSPLSHPPLSSEHVLLSLSPIKWYKSFILEISINGWPLDVHTTEYVEPFSWRNCWRGGGEGDDCSHKYIKWAAYRLISVHKPSEIFSACPRPLPLPEPCIPSGSTEKGEMEEGALIKSLFIVNKARYFLCFFNCLHH